MKQGISIKKCVWRFGHLLVVNCLRGNIYWIVKGIFKNNCRHIDFQNGIWSKISSHLLNTTVFWISTSTFLSQVDGYAMCLKSQHCPEWLQPLRFLHAAVVERCPAVSWNWWWRFVFIHMSKDVVAMIDFGVRNILIIRGPFLAQKS